MKIAHIVRHAKSWLSRKPDPKADFLRAYARYQTACRRGDTRAQHEAWLALRSAMTARLKAAA